MDRLLIWFGLALVALGILWSFLHYSDTSHNARNSSAQSVTLLQEILLYYGCHRNTRESVVVGLGVVVGALGWRQGRLLPGDIVISRPGFTFIFPIATSLLLSVVLTLILWAVSAWRR